MAVAATTLTNKAKHVIEKDPIVKPPDGSSQTAENTTAATKLITTPTADNTAKAGQFVRSTICTPQPTAGVRALVYCSFERSFLGDVFVQ